MRDSKGSYTKPTYIKLSHNHQVLQFGDLQSIACMNGRDILLPLRIMVADISLVEDHTENSGNHHYSESKDYHIWFFDKVHREGWYLTTSSESDFVAWLEGLQTLIGIGNESSEALQMAKDLCEIDLELRLWEYDNNTNGTRMHPPTVALQPPDFNFCNEGGMQFCLEHWRICDIYQKVM